MGIVVLLDDLLICKILVLFTPSSPMFIKVPVPDPPVLRVVPSKSKFDSPFKLLPLPPVITLLSALFDIVAEPDAP